MTLRATGLRVEALIDPLAIDTDRPRLSWRLEGDDTDAPTSTLVRVTDAAGNMLWDSGALTGDGGLAVEYEGPQLAARQRVQWTVEVTAFTGVTTSEPATYGRGQREPSDWSARWIAAVPAPGGPVARLRTTFDVEGPVAEATLYITAAGIYEAFLDGRPVDQGVEFRPGWTDYPTRLPYRAVDVTAAVDGGPHELTVDLADGWWAGHIAYQAKRNRYGQRTGLLAELHVTGADGTTQVVSTDDSWTWAMTGTAQGDIMHGEHHDARVSPGDGGWHPVDLLADDDVPAGRLVAEACQPVRVVGEFPAVSVERLASGAVRFDTGQNLAGVARITVDGAEGTTVGLRHGEVIEPGGDLHVGNLRAAKAEDSYTLDGSGRQTWRPRFTFHGYRYVEADGWPGDPQPADLTSLALSSDLPRTGWFECGLPLVDALVHNSVWGLRSNFLEVPTDCPQRDERLGWMADAHVFVPTACYLVDAQAFLNKWLEDVVDAINDEGGYMDFAPFLGGLGDDTGAPGWADAGVLVPRYHHDVYGDDRILARHAPFVARWAEMLHAANPDGLWVNRIGNEYSDWLAAAPTPKPVVSTACLARATREAARLCRDAGRLDLAARLDPLAERSTAAFVEHHVSADGTVEGDSQSSYVLALAYGLLPPQLRAPAFAKLLACIEEWDDHLTTGFLATPHLLDVLVDGGRPDVAYRLLEQDTFPSWCYQVAQGATTTWERWDGIKPDGTLNDINMNSFNHYAFGAVTAWLFGSVAGIRAAAPGYRHVEIRPIPGGSLERAEAAHDSVRGRIESAWRRVGGSKIALDVTIPAATTATIHIPGGKTVEVGPGRHSFEGEVVA